LFGPVKTKCLERLAKSYIRNPGRSHRSLNRKGRSERRPRKNDGDPALVPEGEVEKVYASHKKRFSL